ncbi:MAG: hypothetical protein ACFUZC_12250 [Chthoniobacteraceae bacterium]
MARWFMVIGNGAVPDVITPSARERIRHGERLDDAFGEIGEFPETAQGIP